MTSQELRARQGADKQMDWIAGLWASWIFFLFYALLTHPNMIIKVLVVALIAISAHDMWEYINNLNEIREEEAEEKDKKNEKSS